MSVEGARRCSKCAAEKPQSEFYRNRARADGLCVHCKACMAAAQRPAEKRYQVTCSGCGAHYLSWSSTLHRTRNGARVFCADCNPSKGAPRIAAECGHCGVSFQPRKTKRHRAIQGQMVFCTEAHHREWRASRRLGREIPCAQCGQVFTTTPQQASHHKAGRRIMCSPECRRANLRKDPATLASAGEKRCTKCRETLPTTSFNRRATTPDGLFLWCRACCAVNQLKYHDLDGVRLTAPVPEALAAAVHTRVRVADLLKEKA